jgi:hypothetical protein
MGRVFLEYLPLGPENDNEYDDQKDHLEDDSDDADEDFKGYIFVCGGCQAHITRGCELVSKDFRGRSGKAYLFNCATNIVCGVAEERLLITGMHTISDIFCFDCGKSLGWKYIHAFEERQRYKVGKVILEAAYVKKAQDARPREITRQSSTSSSSSSSSQSNCS